MIYKVYITENGIPKTGLTPTWEYLYNLSGNDKSSDAPTISEIGGGWYKFSVTYGTTPFNVAELVGVIDAGAALSNSERYIPVTISIRDAALMIFSNYAVYNKSTGDNTVTIYGDDESSTELTMQETQSNDGNTITRQINN